MTAPNLDDVAGALDAAFAPPAAVAVTLRDASRGDPLRGCPMIIDGEEIAPGQWKNAGLVDRWGLPPNCPVRPLGKLGDVFFFLNALGEVHTLTASSSGKGPIDALFAGRSGYLEWMCPRWSSVKDAAKATVSGYHADEVRRVLFDACAFKGVFEDTDKVRGRGAWTDDDGSLIYHAGDAVLIDGEWREPGEIAHFVYPARPRLARPWGHNPGEVAEAIKAGEGSPGDAVLCLLETFRWERPKLDPRLMLGWMMLAKLGGALEQRPVAYIVGEEGAGKTTLQKLIRLEQNGGLVATSNTTQAGIYQKVQQDSIPVSVDEAEAEEDPKAADKLIKLARIAYSGDKMLRGGADHQGKEFTVRSAFLFSSIVQPAMGAQDQTRMFVGMIRARLRQGEGEAAVERLDVSDVGKYGRQLLARFIAWWDRWDGLLVMFRARLLKAGHGDRAADTFGALAAGCHVALRDDFPTRAELEEWAEWLDPAKLQETQGREGTWRRCLNTILDTRAEAFRGLACSTISEYLEEWRAGRKGITDLENALPKVGVQLSFGDKEVPTWENARLFIPATSPSVHELLQGTNWCGSKGAPGPWSGVLRQAPTELWENGSCGKGYSGEKPKKWGMFLHLAKALES